MDNVSGLIKSHVELCVQLGRLTAKVEQLMERQVSREEIWRIANDVRNLENKVRKLEE